MTSAKQREISLPAGFVVEDTLIKNIVVRELMDTEEDIMSDPTLVDELVPNCVTRIGSSIIDRDIIRSMVSNSLYRDWETIFFEIRKLTHGDNYNFSYICGNPTCRRENKNRKLDLRTVKIKPHKEPLKRKFDYVSRDGSRFLFRDKLAGDSTAIAKIVAEKTRALVRLLAVHLEAFNGVIIESDTWQNHVEQGVTLLTKHMPSWSDRENVRRTLNERDFGVDRSVIDECQYCGVTCEHSFNIDVSFLFPSTLL